MATFKYFREGPAIMYNEPNGAPFRRNVNIPALITPGINGGLANTSDVRVALPATGFAAADILQVFQVPLGFMLTLVGARVTTAEGAVCTADIGNNSATQTHLLAIDADGYMGTFDLNSAVTQIVLVADAQLGANNYMGVVFVTNGSIDITFASADTNAAVFDTWACGWKVF